MPRRKPDVSGTVEARHPHRACADACLGTHCNPGFWPASSMAIAFCSRFSFVGCCLAESIQTKGLQSCGTHLLVPLATLVFNQHLHVFQHPRRAEKIEVIDLTDPTPLIDPFTQTLYRQEVPGQGRCDLGPLFSGLWEKSCSCTDGRLLAWTLWNKNVQVVASVMLA